MRAVFLLLCLLLLSVKSFAQQRPDSVQINGEWYFVYPLDEEIAPTYSMLKRTNLSDKQFALLLQWKLAADPRAKLRKRNLEDSLNAELLRTNAILSKEQSESNWEYGTNPPDSYWGAYKMKKRRMRRFPAINVYENNPETYDLIPSVSSLPDGKYIQYFAPFLTYTKCHKMKVISGKTAAVFSLKDNMLHGKYSRLNYNGDTIKVGTFEDGLKEGSWFIHLSSDYGTNYKKGTSKNTLETLGAKLYIDLKDGIPDGNYHSIGGTYSETYGQYKNGFAYGTWKIRNGSQTRIYRNIVYGEDWLKDTSDVLTVIATERTKPAKGFDFSGWKNKSTRPDYYNEFVLKNTIRLKSNAINDFKSLYEDPALGSNLNYKRTSYYEYDNLGKKVRFYGSCETYIDDWMMERITMDPGTHALNYSRYYENGHLFDTMEYYPTDNLFHYRMYDVNGKLYIENTYDTGGNLIDRMCYASFKEKQPKQQKQPTMITIEGFPVLVDRNYYETYGNIGYVWDNKKDSVIDGKHYTYIAWDYDTKKRIHEAYKVGDVLHNLYYNKWGEPALEIESVTADKQLESGAVILVENEIKYTGYWDGFSWVAAKDTSGFFQVKMYKNDQPYSGFLRIRFSRRKVGKHYSGGGNELVLTIPRYYYSRKMNDHFLDLELFLLEERLYHSKERWGYNDDPSVLMQLLSKYLSEDLMTSLNQKEIYGNVTNGVLSGGWQAIARNGEVTTTLNFSNGKGTGSVKLFREYHKPYLFERRWKENDRYYYQEYSDKNPKYYIGTEYQLKNGVYHGNYIRKGVNGDTLLQLTYQNGYPDGMLMRTFKGDTLTGNYRNGVAHGNFSYRVQTSFGKLDTAMFMQYVDGKLNGDFLLKQEDSFNESPVIKRYGDSENDKNAIQMLRVRFKNNQFNGRMVAYDFDKQPRYGISFLDLKPDTLFFYENGEVSYYYKRINSAVIHDDESLLMDSVLISIRAEEKIANQILSAAGFLVNNPLESLNQNYQYWLTGIGGDLEELKFGSFTKLYPNNNVARTGNRFYNKSVGLWKFYGYEGNLLYAIDYEANSGEDDTLGIYTEYGVDGSVLSKRYLIEELEKYDCAHSDYYAIRQFIVFEDQKDSIDRSNGLQRNYFDNGVLMSEGNLENGLPEGVWKFFTPDGRMTIVGKYVNGKKEGRWLYGDLGDKKYIGEICLNPDDPFLDFHIAELEKKKDIQVKIYRNGKAVVSQFHELNKP